MSQVGHPVNVYLESGQKRVFAGALDWPGWCRSGRDVDLALQALLEAGPRYARVLHAAGLDFEPPGDVSAFEVVERLPGNTTTDFGAPDAAPSADAVPVDDLDLQRFRALLQACWQAFDASAEAAAGRTLRSGPRGGGRDVEGIVKHVLGADTGYLSSLGWKRKPGTPTDPIHSLHQVRQAMLDGLAAAARGEIPAQGPRGGARWTPRYFVRRVAWHVLDHAWEIEDRLLP